MSLGNSFKPSWLPGSYKMSGVMYSNSPNFLGGNLGASPANMSCSSPLSNMGSIRESLLDVEGRSKPHESYLPNSFNDLICSPGGAEAL